MAHTVTPEPYGVVLTSSVETVRISYNMQICGATDSLL
jgi:hypothetical protein